MGHSIFYSLALPAKVSVSEATHKLLALFEQATSLKNEQSTKVKANGVKTLSAVDFATAQATMNDDFSFARSACSPPGRDRRLPLGEVPEVGMYFHLYIGTNSRVNIGICQYKKSAAFQMIGDDSDKAEPYDVGTIGHTLIVFPKMLP